MSKLMGYWERWIIEVAYPTFKRRFGGSCMAKTEEYCKRTYDEDAHLQYTHKSVSNRAKDMNQIKKKRQTKLNIPQSKLQIQKGFDAVEDKNVNSCNAAFMLSGLK